MHLGVKPSVSPPSADRFSVTSRPARVSSRAWRSSGTSRCGITLLNHEPGPSTTQSASAIAASASGQAGGSGGTSSTATTGPGAVATAC